MAREGFVNKKLKDGTPYRHYIENSEIIVANYKSKMEEWDFEENEKNDLNPYHISKNSMIKANWICKEGHKWMASIGSRINGNRGCPYCSNKKVLFGYNDIYTTNSELRKYFVDINIAKNHVNKSGKKAEFKCINCGDKKILTIYDFYNNGYGCKICGDGFPFGEKLISNILTNYNISYETQKTFNWSNKKRYDFYIPQYSMIIETDGLQHKEDVGGYFKYNEIKSNDKIKLELAESNGIKFYINIDTSNNDINAIKHAINNSGMLEILKIKNINFKEFIIKASNSTLVNICETFKTEKDTNNLATQFNVSRCTVIRYLNKGASLGLCNYNPKESSKTRFNNRRRGDNIPKPIIIVETGKVYDSISKTIKEEKVSRKNILDSIEKEVPILGRTFKYYIKKEGQNDKF